MMVFFRTRQNKFSFDKKFLKGESLTFTHCSGVSIVDFEQVNSDWENVFLESHVCFLKQIF